MVSFEAMYYGISIQESNGSYSALGPQLSSGRAYGKYQIMDFNIPSWTQQYYGKRLTPQQFLANPAAQEATAKGKLKSYYDKYGDRGMAAAWYSGNPNLHMSTAPQGAAGPSIKSYVDGVISHSAKYSGQSSGASSSSSSAAALGSGGSTSNVTPSLDREDLMARYGMTEGILKASPDLRNVFDKAVSGQYTAARFQAEVQNTSWYKKGNENWRKAWLKSFTDPATHKQDLKKFETHAISLANEYGIKDKKTLQELRIELQWQGWTDEQARRYLAARVPAIKAGQTFGGKLGEYQSDLTEIAYNNGISADPAFLNKWVRAIGSGSASMEQAEADIRKRASSLFAPFKKQILAGEDAMDLASPYIKTMGQLLEMPDGKLDLFDGTVRKGLGYKTKDGTAAMALWQFEDLVRQDKRWTATNNARESMMSTAHKVAQDFGMMY